MKIILLGPPGAGKGTQAALLSKSLEIPKISTGDMLRTAAAEGSEFGEKVKKIMSLGNLVSDEMVIEIVRKRITQEDCKEGFLLDGFPRTVEQAKALQDSGVVIDHVIEVFTPKKSIIQRLGGRRIHPASGRTYHVLTNPSKVSGKDDETGEDLIQRPDDNEITITKRLEVYEKQTTPLIQFYKELAKQSNTGYVFVDGGQSMYDVHRTIMQVIGAT